MHLFTQQIFHSYYLKALLLKIQLGPVGLPKYYRIVICHGPTVYNANNQFQFISNFNLHDRRNDQQIHVRVSSFP